ncbi:MAG: DUF262 domain-containing protein [Verrucomicrobiota bacterium]|jgi:uncharacterized protein with ParB-like and HNH nuclease domain
MEASPAKVIQYFNGEKQNLIPLFQRPYTWKKANWQTLWDDVMVQYDAGDSSTHFMGAIVSVPARSVPVGVSKFLIIDGQQRLTTVALLLCALRDSLDANSAARIQEVYLTNKFREPEDTPKFVPTQADREIYFAIAISKVIPENDCLILQAYHFFKQELCTGYDLNGETVLPAKVLTTLEHALQVVMINLDDSDDPYLIFESLNFKGEPLNQADLVRNYVLMRFRHSISVGGEQERVYLSCWRPMENQLGENLPEFLRHYAMKDGDDINRGGIYAAIKARLKNMNLPQEVEAEVQHMHRFGRFYAMILQPELETKPTVRARLENIKELRVTTSYPLLLRLFDARETGTIDDAEVERFLGLVESFVVRRAVCGVPTNSLNKLFLQWAKNFPTSDHANWLQTSMSSGGGGRRFPNDTEFADAFKNQPQYGRGATRFILCRLERSFMHKEPVDLATATIEHVMPQTLTPEWEIELDVSPKDAQEVHQRLLHTIGNLTLTGYNPELGNISFSEKKLKLANTHIEMNRWILGREKWRGLEIVVRAGELLRIANEIWAGPARSS